MLTLRNLGGVALFLFGTTFVWMTPEFASRGVSTASTWWSITRILALVTLCGFTVATWGLFQRDGWWDTVAIGSAAVGLVTVVPYLIAAVRSGETSPWFTGLISVLGSGAVLALLLVPSVARWVDGHVMSS